MGSIFLFNDFILIFLRITNILFLSTISLLNFLFFITSSTSLERFFIIYNNSLSNLSSSFLILSLKIRKELDKLDNELLNIIKKRSKLVDEVIKNKKFKRDIVDKKRILVILKNIKIKSLKRKIDPIVTNKIWSTMIRAFINYEYRNFKKK